jgi:hypothetical protein
MIDATRSTHNQEIINSYLTGYNKGKLDSKNELIDKACEWLKLNTDWDDKWDEMGRNINYGKIEEFRKAMEE